MSDRMAEEKRPDNRSVSIPKRCSDRIFKQSLIVLLLLFLLAAALDPEWFIEDEDIKVTVPEYKVGDTGNYRTSADYRISGTQVLTIESFDIKSLGFMFGKEGRDKGYMNVSIEDLETVQNGFGEHVSAYSILVEEEFPGSVSATLNSNQAEEFEITVNHQDRTYYQGDFPFRTDMTAHFDYEAGIFSIGGDSDATFFPNDPPVTVTDGRGITNPIRDVFRNKTMTKGMGGAWEGSGIFYNWSVVNEDRVMKRDCLIVEFEYDHPSIIEHLTHYLPIFDVGGNVKIQEAVEKVWISDGISMPVKRVISIKGTVGSNDISVDLIEEMVEFHEGDGQQVLTSENNPDPDQMVQQVHQLAEKEEWHRFPLHGNGIDSSIPADFNITTAFNEANASTENLTAYLEENPGSYLVLGRYNESNETGIWNLTFSAPGNETGYSVNVSRHTGTIVTQDHGERDLLSVDPRLTVTSERNGLEHEVITWSSAEDIFRNNTEVNRTAFSPSTGRMDLDHNSFGVRTDLWFPPDLLFSFNIRQWGLYDLSPYGYFIKSEYDEQSDGEGWFFFTGVDAFSGQVLFVSEYSVS